MRNGTLTKVAAALVILIAGGAVTGSFLVYRQLGELTVAVRAQGSVQADHSERIRYLERRTRGLTVGE